MLFWTSYLMLWTLVLCQSMIIIVLVRDHARARKTDAVGLAIGTKVPALDGQVLGWNSGDSVLRCRGEAIVVVFLAVGCEPCVHVREVVAAVSEQQDVARVVVSCSGDHADVVGFAKTLGERTIVVADTRRQNARGWRVSRQPCAIAVDEGGTVVGDTYYVTEENLVGLVGLAAGRVREAIAPRNARGVVAQ